LEANAGCAARLARRASPRRTVGADGAAPPSGEEEVGDPFDQNTGSGGRHVRAHRRCAAGPSEEEIARFGRRYVLSARRSTENPDYVQGEKGGRLVP
jgi:hypothetical protein